jgi:hypothetical protein
LSESERDELHRLRKENAELAMERDVLKRSAALWVLCRHRQDSDRRCRHNRRASKQVRMSSMGGFGPVGGPAAAPIKGSFLEVEVGELWRGLDPLVFYMRVICGRSA